MFEHIDPVGNGERHGSWTRRDSGYDRHHWDRERDRHPHELPDRIGERGAFDGGNLRQPRRVDQGNDRAFELTGETIQTDNSTEALGAQWRAADANDADGNSFDLTDTRDQVWIGSIRSGRRGSRSGWS